MIDLTATDEIANDARVDSKNPAVLIGLLVLALSSFARRRERLPEIDEFPEPSI